MADTEISDLSAASALAGTEVAPVVQSGVNVKATIDQIKTYVLSDLGAAVGASLALGGAALGGNVLAATGVFTISGNIISGSNVVCGADFAFGWNGRGGFTSPADGIIQLENVAGTGFSRLTYGGATSSYPCHSRNGVGLEVKLADASAFTTLKAKLTTDAAATTGLTAGVLSALTNASIVVYDGGGQAYRIPCII